MTISTNLDKGFGDEEFDMLESKYDLVRPSKLIERQYSSDDIKQLLTRAFEGAMKLLLLHFISSVN